MGSKKKIKKMPGGGEIDRKSVDFLNSYLQSPTFKERFLKHNASVDYSSQMAEFNTGMKAFNPYILEKDPKNDRIGSRVSNPTFNKIWGVPLNTNIVLSRPQANEVGADLFNDVLPHEYSHTVRKMTPMDEIYTLSYNKNSAQALNDYTKWMKSDKKKDFEGWNEQVKGGSKGHDTSPNEQYSDLNALRWMMYKEGIYDTRKGDMKLEDIKKALGNKNIKGSFMMKRMLKNFTPQGIVDFNNTIAKNNDNNQQDTAKNGMVMRVKSKNFWYETLPSARSKDKLLMADMGMGMSPGPINPLKNIPENYFDQFYPQGQTGGPSLLPNYQQPNTNLIPLPSQGSAGNLSPVQGPKPQSTPAYNQPQFKQKSPYGPGDAIMLGLAAFDAALPHDKITKQMVVRPEDHQVYNQNPYGTGSQALYTGGQIMSIERTNPIVISEGMEDNMPSAKDGHWIQKAVNPKHKGYCTPMTKKTCTPRRKALARTFKKHHGFHEDGGWIEDEIFGSPIDIRLKTGGIIPDNMSVFNPHRYEHGGSVNLLEKIVHHPNMADMMMAYYGQNVPNLLEKIVQHPNQMDMTKAYEGQNIPNLLEKIVQHPNKADMKGFKRGGQLSPAKAKEILRDGTAQGHKLTAKQKRYFGWIAGGGKAAEGDVIGDPGDPVVYSVKSKQLAQNQAGARNASVFRDLVNQGVSTGQNPLQSNYAEELRKSAQGWFKDPTNRRIVDAVSAFNARPDLAGMSPQQRLENFYSMNSSDPSIQRFRELGKSANYGPLGGGITTYDPHASAEELRAVAGIQPVATSFEQGGTLMYDDGGQVETMWGGNARKTSDNPYDGGTIQFDGASHDDGGIGMHYNGNPVEVEGGETAAKDSQGNLNIFGNMYVPGTRTKFKTVSKQISDKERRYDFLKSRGSELVNNSNPANKFDLLTFNAGRVMMLGGDIGQKDLASKKEKLSSLQKAMLETADDFGIDAHDFSKGIIKKAKKGAQIKKKAAEGDVIVDDQQDPNDPKRADRNRNPGNIRYGKWAKDHGATGQDKDGFAIFPDVNTGLVAMKGLLKSPSYNNMTVRDAIHKWTGRAPYRYDLGAIDSKKVSDLTPEEFETTINTMRKGEGTRYGLVGAPPTQRPPAPPAPPRVAPPTYGLPPVEPFTPEQPIVPVGATPPDDHLIIPPDRQPLPTNAEPLHMNQLLGEIYGIATNKQIPVVAQKYIPEQYVPYQVSFQDRLNQNQDAFSAISRQVGPSNPSALGALAAQKYSADNAVKGEEFRTNQAIAQDITNKNIALENDAQLKNLGIADTQYVRQSTAGSKTRQFNQMIVNSLSSKFAQNEFENKRLKAYENLYDYRFVPNERGGDTATYFGPNAVFNFDPASAMARNQDVRTVSRYDSQGNLKGYTTYDESQLKEAKEAIDLELQRRRVPLLSAPKLFAGGHL